MTTPKATRNRAQRKASASAKLSASGKKATSVVPAMRDRVAARNQNAVGIPSEGDYDSVLADVVRLVESGRRVASRSVNAATTAVYWAIGRRIVEQEQHGAKRAAYGQELITRLSVDLLARLGRGFGRANLLQMRAFYLGYREILQTPSGESRSSDAAAILQTLSGESLPEAVVTAIASNFPLPWSQYVRLMSVRNPEARRFYEIEALRGGWTTRQLNRQIESQFYERTALSKNKAAMLRSASKREPGDELPPHEEIKDPYLLEFLNLKDEYSETDLENALVQKLETFLLELGGDFTFVGRQRRLRVGDEWYRVDLLFFHRRLRCLVIIDLKLGKFTHADAGQMHLYLNYAREHWTLPGENPPVGLILCAEKNTSVARYALEGLPNKVLAAEYRTALPKENVLVDEIQKTRNAIEIGAKKA
jgi:predicted nuclease of restriction endonuclease-like (RecB) superfamily